MFRFRNPTLSHLEIREMIGRPEQHIYRVRVGSHENGQDKYKDYVCWRIRQEMVFFNKTQGKKKLQAIDGAYRLFIVTNAKRIRGKILPMMLSAEPYTIDPTQDIQHIGEFRPIQAK